jgi:lipoprotein NlpD
MTPPPVAARTAPFRTAPGVEGRPLSGTQGSASATAAPATGAPGTPSAGPGTVAAARDGVKTEPQGVRVPYSDQAYAQLASVRPSLPQARPEAPASGAAPEGDDIQFAWPATGKLVNTFSDAASLKGIGIAGKAGQPVYASAPGKVIFSGTGIRGFGKLIVIKHNNTFLSVYGHNSELLVKEGQNVAKGQKIAEMGNTDADEVKLHFEIRRFGKPVDPVKMLPPEPPG